MGSKKSYLKVFNQTDSRMHITVSDVDNFDWDGNSRPDHNFDDVWIDAFNERKEREEVNSNSDGCWFTMDIRFDDGGHISFRNDQLDAFTADSVPQTYCTRPSNGKIYTVTQSRDGVTNTFVITAEVNPISQWMKTVPDDRDLTYMSLAGTHDSISTDGSGTLDFARCQRWSISGQLSAGVRYLDIRMKALQDPPYLQGYHGVKRQPSSFPEILDEIRGFLGKYPTETVLLQLKQESSGWSEYDFARLVFTKFVREDRYRDLFLLGEKLPSLGQCRGKIVLINRFVDDVGYGFNAQRWGDNRVFHWHPQHDGADRAITATYINTKNKRRYFFSGLEYCKISQETKKRIFDWHSVHEYFPEVGKPITGALQIENDQSSSHSVYFFSGRECGLFSWSGNGRSEFSGWVPVSTAWSGVDRPIDGAFQYPDKPTECYLFSGGKFCRCDTESRTIVDSWEDVKTMWKGPSLVIRPGRWDEYKQQGYYIQDRYDLGDTSARLIEENLKTADQVIDDKMAFVNQFFREAHAFGGYLRLCFCSSVLKGAPGLGGMTPSDFAASDNGVNKRVLKQHLKGSGWGGGVVLFDFIDSHFEVIDWIKKKNE